MTIMATIDGFSLLPELEVLLVERHVTRAARRLGVTQSTMSHTLAKLRAHFGDELLVRSGSRMELTPKAESMLAPLSAALGAVRDAVAARAVFEPGHSDRTFSIGAPDLLAPAVPELIARLASEAPRVRLVVGPFPPSAEGRLSPSPDLLLGPVPKSAPGLVMKRLGEVSFCVLARRGHPVARKLTVSAWQRYPHVIVTTGNGAPNRVAEALEAAGIRRTVGLTVSGFLAAPWVVAKTDMLLAAPRELSGEIAEALGLVRLRPPVPLPKIPIAVMWPQRAATDAGHRWLRELVTETLLARLGRTKSAP